MYNSNKCPICKAEAEDDLLEYDMVEPIGNNVIQKVKCNNCNSQWKIVYSPTLLEEIEDGTTGIITPSIPITE